MAAASHCDNIVTPNVLSYHITMLCHNPADLGEYLTNTPATVILPTFGRQDACRYVANINYLTLKIRVF